MGGMGSSQWMRSYQVLEHPGWGVVSSQGRGGPSLDQLSRNHAFIYRFICCVLKVCMNVGLPAYLCTTFISNTHECYERVLNPLQLEL